MYKIHAILTLFFLSLPLSGACLAGELEPLFPGYPEIFTVRGTLDIIVEEEKRMVINDSNYLIHSSTTFHAPDGKASLSDFSENDEVGVMLKERGAKELLSLWLIKTVEPTTEPVTNNTPSDGDTLRLEDGVWKN